MAAVSKQKVHIQKYIWDKVFKSGPRKICGRQPLKYFSWTILEYSEPLYYLKN